MNNILLTQMLVELGFTHTDGKIDATTPDGTIRMNGIYLSDFKIRGESDPLPEPKFTAPVTFEWSCQKI